MLVNQTFCEPSFSGADWSLVGRKDKSIHGICMLISVRINCCLFQGGRSTTETTYHHVANWTPWPWGLNLDSMAYKLNLYRSMIENESDAMGSMISQQLLLSLFYQQRGGHWQRMAGWCLLCGGCFMMNYNTQYKALFMCCLPSQVVGSYIYLFPRLPSGCHFPPFIPCSP